MASDMAQNSNLNEESVLTTLEAVRENMGADRMLATEKEGGITYSQLSTGTVTSQDHFLILPRSFEHEPRSLDHLAERPRIDCLRRSCVCR